MLTNIFFSFKGDVKTIIQSTNSIEENSSMNGKVIEDTGRLLSGRPLWKVNIIL